MYILVHSQNEILERTREFSISWHEQENRTNCYGNKTKLQDINKQSCNTTIKWKKTYEMKTQ